MCYLIIVLKSQQRGVGGIVGIERKLEQQSKKRGDDINMVIITDNIDK